MHPSPADPIPSPALDQIGTCWERVHDPAYFVVRYAPAIRGYLQAMLKNTHDAEEATQDFLLRVHEHGLRNASREGGRFRDYLKKAVRNAGLNWLRRKQAAHRDALPLNTDLADDVPPQTDQRWLAEWRGILIDRAWHALEQHQQKAPGNLCHTVLRLAVDHPDEDSTALAARASAQAGRVIRPGAFRQQLSVARRLFAERLVLEVIRTLRVATPDQIQDELIELGLMEHVRPFLSAEGRNRGQRPSPE